MDLKEFETLCNDFGNTDKIPETLIVLKDGVTNLFQELESAKTSITELTESNNNLRDMNMKLALRITNAVDNPVPKEETLQEFNERMRKKRFEGDEN